MDLLSISKVQAVWAEPRPGMGFALLNIAGQPRLLSFPVTQEEKSQKEGKQQFWGFWFFYMKRKKERILGWKGGEAGLKVKHTVLLTVLCVTSASRFASTCLLHFLFWRMG